MPNLRPVLLFPLQLAAPGLLRYVCVLSSRHGLWYYGPSPIPFHTECLRAHLAASRLVAALPFLSYASLPALLLVPSFVFWLSLSVPLSPLVPL